MKVIEILHYKLNPYQTHGPTTLDENPIPVEPTISIEFTHNEFADLVRLLYARAPSDMRILNGLFDAANDAGIQYNYPDGSAVFNEGNYDAVRKDEA